MISIIMTVTMALSCVGAASQDGEGTQDGEQVRR